MNEKLIGKIENSFVYARNFIFGVEDSLVSTVGLLSGVAFAGVSKQIIILTGLILIFVEAFSMGIGSFLSEQSAKEFMARATLPIRRSVTGGIIMFFSYLISGFIPLSPYIFVDAPSAFKISIFLSLVTLFSLGAIGAKIFKIKILRSALRMLIVGGIAITVGILVGGFVK